MNYYISLRELNEVFHISCESLEYDKNIKEFQRIIKNLLNVGILRPSKKQKQENNKILSDGTHANDPYFMVICPIQLKAIIDTIFECS